MKEHCSWMEKTFSFCFIKLCVPCSLCFSSCWCFICCVLHLTGLKTWGLMKKRGIGWALFVREGFASVAVPGVDGVTCLFVKTWVSACLCADEWYETTSNGLTLEGRWKMTPPTEKGLHAKTSLLSLCLTITILLLSFPESCLSAHSAVSTLRC